MSIELAIRLKKALQAAHMTGAELARALDETPQSVHSWLKTGRINKQKLAKVAKATGADLGYLISGEPPAPTANEGGVPSSDYLGVRDVPIIGHVIANPTEDGYFDDMGFPPGAGEGYVPWATRDRNAYAVRVKGDSYQPRYRPGEVLVVEPNAANVSGDDVIVRTKDGRKMLKKLQYQRGTEITLGSINDRYSPLSISVEEIESIHHVAGSVQRGTSTKE
jgi:phage repressor protein C with HTH and peptisase S24 domain